MGDKAAKVGLAVRKVSLQLSLAFNSPSNDLIHHTLSQRCRFSLIVLPSETTQHVIISPKHRLHHGVRVTWSPPAILTDG